MARFFLHLHECGEIVVDEEGRECADLEAARAIAIESARDVLCAEIREGRLCLACSIEIVDHDDRLLLSVPFRDVVVITGL